MNWWLKNPLSSPLLTQSYVGGSFFQKPERWRQDMSSSVSPTAVVIMGSWPRHEFPSLGVREHDWWEKNRTHHQFPGTQQWALPLSPEQWCHSKTDADRLMNRTLPKAQRTRGLSSSYQSNFLRSYHNFTNLDQISSSESRLKNQFLNQTSASPINLKFKISTKHSFRIATKIQLHNLYKTSASKCWTNSSFKILPELQLQNLDQPLCSKSEQKFSFMTKRQLQICNKLLPTRCSSSTSATVTTSTSIELASLHTRVASIKFTKRQWVSESLTSIPNDRTRVR